MAILSSQAKIESAMGRVRDVLHRLQELRLLSTRRRAHSTMYYVMHLLDKKKKLLLRALDFQTSLELNRASAAPLANRFFSIQHQAEFFRLFNL